MTALFFLVSFLASVAGAVCGIGGGVIIKPVLDLFGLASVATISFLSGCTVLAMSCYSVARSLLAGERQVRLRTGTPLALGAAAGGVAGRQLFGLLQSLAPDPDQAGAVQAGLLALATAGALVYTLNRSKFRPLCLHHPAACATIGLGLGLLSSFLGIGGGPINLVVLYYFFDMPTKTAAANSLYIILFSQSASLIATLAGGGPPPFAPAALLLMVAGGILGAAAGRAVNRRISAAAVERLFAWLMGAIILISLSNLVRYL